MTQLLYLLLAMFLVTIVSCRWIDTTTLSPTDVEQLKETRARLKQAMLNGDVETLNEVYSEDYELITRKGNLISRAERIQMLESGKLKYLYIGDETDITIKTYGSFAMVRGLVSAAETEFNGERRRSGLRRFIEIWIHKNGKWLEVTRQATVVEYSAP